MSWELRRAGVGDLDRIMTLENATFPEDAWSTRAMRSELSSEHGFYLLADDPATPETVAGYAGLSAPAGAGQAEVQTLAVAESARRHGLGRALLQALLEEADLRGATEVFLEVRADNPAAQALYAAEGFTQSRIRRRYYPGGVDAIVMRRGA